MHLVQGREIYRSVFQCPDVAEMLYKLNEKHRPNVAKNAAKVNAKMNMSCDIFG